MLIKKVSEKDIKGIRNGLLGYLAIDTKLKKDGPFDTALNYVLSNGISESELFEKDDNKDLPTYATKENVTKICSMMAINFSIEKLDLAKNMCRILYPEA